MVRGIIGRKVGMTEVFTESGALVPVTVVEVGDCTITQVKLKESDGYSAIQIGHGDKKPQNVIKARQGLFKKAGVKPKALLKEVRVDSDEEISHLKPGQVLSASMFAKGDFVDVMGTSKGRGFAGVFKRHNFKGPNASHGTHEYFRHGGSIGSNTYPGRVFKNLRMPGQMGNVQRTVQNVEVVDVDTKLNVILLKGGLPGSEDGLLVIRTATKKAAPKEARAWVSA